LAPKPAAGGMFGAGASIAAAPVKPDGGGGLFGKPAETAKPAGVGGLFGAGAGAGAPAKPSANLFGTGSASNPLSAPASAPGDGPGSD
jgi:hypothetical protein